MCAKKKTLSVSDVKEANVREVLRCLKQDERISRAGISRATGLSRPTVSTLVYKLLEEGYILEGGPDDVSGKTKPIMLRLNRSHKYAIGLDYSSSHLIRGCICDMGYHIVAKNERPCLANQDNILEITAELIDELLQTMPSTGSLAGIGIGVTGIVDTVKNRVIESERYDLNINDYEMGYASALSVVTLIGVLILSLGFIKMMNGKREKQ